MTDPLHLPVDEPARELARRLLQSATTGSLASPVQTDPAHGSARQRFLSCHLKAALYADFPDFRFGVVAIDRGLLNGGFGRAHTLTAADPTPCQESVD